VGDLNSRYLDSHPELLTTHVHAGQGGWLPRQPTSHFLCFGCCWCLGFDVVVVLDVGVQESLLPKRLATSGKLALVFTVVPLDHYYIYF